VTQGGGLQVAQFTHDREGWTTNLYYEDSGVDHPGEATLDGTRFEIENIREFRLAISSADDPVGQLKFNAHLAPRWRGMKSNKKNQIPVPEGFGEGVKIRVSGSNIEFNQYLTSLQRAADAVGIDPSYFADPHPYSNIQDAERYVRLNHEVSGPIYARDGPLVTNHYSDSQNRSVGIIVVRI
jgi:hypothetical protein